MRNIIFYRFVNAMVYYGVSLNVSSFAGDVFVNNAIAGAVEFPGYMICVPLLYWGRKKGLASMMLLAGVCLIVVPFTSGKLSLIFNNQLLITALLSEEKRVRLKGFMQFFLSKIFNLKTITRMTE